MDIAHIIIQVLLLCLLVAGRIYLADNNLFVGLSSEELTKIITIGFSTVATLVTLSLSMCFISIFDKEKWNCLRREYISESDLALLEGLGSGSISILFQFGSLRKSRYLTLLLGGLALFLTVKIYSKAIVGSFSVSQVMQSETRTFSWFEPTYFLDFSGNAEDTTGLSEIVSRVTSAFLYDSFHITNSSPKNIAFQALPQAFNGSLKVENATIYKVDVKCAFFNQSDMVYDAEKDEYNITNSKIIEIDPFPTLSFDDVRYKDHFNSPRVDSYRTQGPSKDAYDLIFFPRASNFNQDISIPPTFTEKGLGLYVVMCATETFEAKVMINYTAINTATILEPESIHWTPGGYNNDGMNKIMGFMSQYNIGYENTGSYFSKNILVQDGNPNNSINDLPQRLEQTIAFIKTQFLSMCMSYNNSGSDSDSDIFIPRQGEGELSQVVFAITGDLKFLTTCVVMQSIALVIIIVFVTKNRIKVFPADKGIITVARMCRDSNIYDVLNELEEHNAAEANGRVGSVENSSVNAALMHKTETALSVRLEGSIINAKILSNNIVLSNQTPINSSASSAHSDLSQV
ncbi:hypothetical protein BGZ76_011413 [Entomortierella beljakovae]|nr:hypothetical protein BGZ76_011413 [Entomortierella beljakovae]